MAKALPKTVNMNIRIAEDIKKKLQRLADLNRRTLSDYIRLELEKVISAARKIS